MSLAAAAAWTSGGKGKSSNEEEQWPFAEKKRSRDDQGSGGWNAYGGFDADSVSKKNQ